MKLYQPQEKPENTKAKLEREISNFAVNSILSPIALLALVILLLMLIPLAFGSDSNWGIIPKAMVGVGVPALIIASLINKRVGNTVFLIWYVVFWLGIWGVVAYFFFIPIIKWSFGGYMDLF